MEILRSYHKVRFASGIELDVVSAGTPTVQRAVDYVLKNTDLTEFDLMERADKVLERAVKSELVHTRIVDRNDWNLIIVDDALYSIARVYEGGDYVMVTKEVIGVRSEFYRKVPK